MNTKTQTHPPAHLLGKYSVSVPRYTSYPTAPEWKDTFTKNDFLTACELGNKNQSPLSLYFHLPFCESECYFCACNIVISKKRYVVEPYIKHIKNEILKTSKLIDKNRVVEQIHLGGGSPTYFTPDEMRKADEAFLTGSVREVMTIRTLDGTAIGKGSPGPVTQKLAYLYKSLVNEYCSTHKRSRVM